MFFHTKGAQREARYTIAGVVTETGTMKLAAARCSEKDQFSRKKGRMIAQGRLACAKSDVCQRWTVTVGFEEDKTSESFLLGAQELIKHVEKEVETDRRKMAKSGLHTV